MVEYQRAEVCVHSSKNFYGWVSYIPDMFRNKTDNSCIEECQNIANRLQTCREWDVTSLAITRILLFARCMGNVKPTVSHLENGPFVKSLHSSDLLVLEV